MIRFQYQAINNGKLLVKGSVEADSKELAQQKIKNLGWTIRTIEDSKTIKEALAKNRKLQEKVFEKKRKDLSKANKNKFSWKALWQKLRQAFHKEQTPDKKEETSTTALENDLTDIDFRKVLRDTPIEGGARQQTVGTGGSKINLDINKIAITSESPLKLYFHKLALRFKKFIYSLIGHSKKVVIERQIIDIKKLEARRKLQTVNQSPMEKLITFVGGSKVKNRPEGKKRILILKGFFGKRDFLGSLLNRFSDFKKLRSSKEVRKLNFRKSENEREKEKARDVLLVKGYEKTGNVLLDTFNWLNEQVVNLTPIKSKELMSFYQLLAVMINAGIPLLKSLKQLLNQVKNPKFKKILYVIVHEIENGSSLSSAMLNFPATFDDAEIGMVQAGEASGQLGQVLKRVAEQTEKRLAMKGRIKNAMMYPVAVLCVLGIVGVIVMIYIVPKLTEIFSDANVELPTSTKLLIGLSNFLTSFWYLLIFAVAGIIFGIKATYKTAEGKYYIDYIKLKIPVFGGLLQKVAVARFARSLSTLSASGIAIIKALKINANSVGNEIYKQEILTTSEAVKKGVGISKDLENNRLFPEMVINMLAIGEETAQIGPVAGKIADFYEEEVDDSLKNLSSLIEPLIIVVIAIAVGFLVMAIMGPVMQLSDVASSIE
ncbi:MAG: type II secretion system F family protein [Candidatus Gracilibacteria bacterium]|nr:type II secretion system F family protein [Candidatus Gracilibacteria bacterium]